MVCTSRYRRVCANLVDGFASSRAKSIAPELDSNRNRVIRCCNACSVGFQNHGLKTNARFMQLERMQTGIALEDPANFVNSVECRAAQDKRLQLWVKIYQQLQTHVLRTSVLISPEFIQLKRPNSTSVAFGNRLSAFSFTSGDAEYVASSWGTAQQLKHEKRIPIQPYLFSSFSMRKLSSRSVSRVPISC